MNAIGKKNRRLVMAGASGLIGRPLCRLLAEQGWQIAILSRRPQPDSGNRITHLAWDGVHAGEWEAALSSATAVIHLAGEPIASRWTKAKKDAILSSRLHSTTAIAAAIARAAPKPHVLLQASAIGYYGGDRADEELDERSAPGSGFLADVARQWEAASFSVESLGVRRVLLRTGVVLGTGYGALPRLVLPFRFFLGGPLASGSQWVSWISLEDEVRAIAFLLAGESNSGAFNLTAPHPVRQRELASAIASALRRRSWLPVPRFALRLFLGEMAKELLIASQRVSPRKLLEAGFTFHQPHLQQALQEIFSTGRP